MKDEGGNDSRQAFESKMLMRQGGETHSSTLLTRLPLCLPSLPGDISDYEREEWKVTSLLYY
jgi:hypothetical protein